MPHLILEYSANLDKTLAAARMARVGRGRSEEELQRAGDLIFAALTEFLDPLYCKRPLAISMEFVEISTWKQNNLRHYLSKDKP